MDWRSLIPFRSQGDEEAAAYMRSPGLRLDVSRTAARHRLPRAAAGPVGVAPRRMPKFRAVAVDPEYPFPGVNVTRERVDRASPMDPLNPGAHAEFVDFYAAHNPRGQWPEWLQDNPGEVAGMISPARLEPPDADAPVTPPLDLDAEWAAAVARARARGRPKRGEHLTETASEFLRSLPRR